MGRGAGLEPISMALFQSSLHLYPRRILYVQFSKYFMFLDVSPKTTCYKSRIFIMQFLYCCCFSTSFTRVRFFPHDIRKRFPKYRLELLKTWLQFSTITFLRPFYFLFLFLAHMQIRLKKHRYFIFH